MAERSVFFRTEGKRTEKGPRALVCCFLLETVVGRLSHTFLFLFIVFCFLGGHSTLETKHFSAGHWFFHFHL